jgi:hypothetical protein
LFREGKVGTNFGVGAWEVAWDIVECIEDADAECECRVESPRFCEFDRLVFARFDVELVADIIEGSGEEVRIGGEGGLLDSSCPTHQSHKTHPRTVAMLPQPTTETGETRS